MSQEPESLRRPGCPRCGTITAYKDGILCTACGGPGIPFIDRRGQPKEERKPLFPPGAVTDIRQTEDPYKLVAIMPGNCIPEREFRITDQEKYGFLLLGRSAKGVGAKGQKAIAAARKKVMGVIREAVRDHSMRQGTAGPSSQVAEPEGPQ